MRNANLSCARLGLLVAGGIAICVPANSAEPARVFRSEDLYECSLRLSTPTYLVDEAGDFDGDGLSDIIAVLDDNQYYIIYGQKDLWGAVLDSRTVWGRRPEVRKTRIQPPVGLPTAMAVGGGGDVNGDGYDDVVIVAAQEYPCDREFCQPLVDRVAFFLIFGTPGGLDEEVEVENLISSQKAVALMSPEDWTHSWEQGDIRIEFIEDMNGDGYNELGIAEPFLFRSDPGYGGALLVLFGSQGLPSAGSIDLGLVGAAVPGFSIVGGASREEGEAVGAILAGLGDIDGDGYGDLGFTIMLRPTQRDVHVMYGGMNLQGRFRASALPTERILVLTCSGAIGAAGDIDRDARNDYLLSAGTGGLWDEIWVVYGGERLIGHVDGRALIGQARVTRFSNRVDEAEKYDIPEVILGQHDISGDGIPDFLFGSHRSDVSRGPNIIKAAGRGTVIAGRIDFPTDGIISSEELASNYGIRIEGGDAREHVFRNPGLLRDFDGDGLGEVFFIGGTRGLPYFHGTCIVPWSCLQAQEFGLTSVSPTSGSTDGGTIVRVVGSGFSSEVEVYFGESRAEVVEVVSSSLALVRTPAHAAGGVDVRVVKGEESVRITNAFRYEERVTRIIDMKKIAEEGAEFHLERVGKYLRGSALLRDFDGDGAGDVALLEATYGRPEAERLHIVLNAAARAGVTVLDGPLSDRMVVEGTETLVLTGVLGAGDLNGDGLTDIVTRVLDRSGSKPYPNGVAIVYGRSMEAGSSVTSSIGDSFILWRGDEGCGSWAETGTVADADGDGLDDIVVVDGAGEACTRGAVVVYGSPALRDTGRDDVEALLAAGGAAVISLWEGVILGVDAGRDLDGDGEPEVAFLQGDGVVVLRSPGRFVGRIILGETTFHGDPCGGIRLTRMRPPMRALGMAEDVNGDGYGEILAGNPLDAVEFEPRVGVARTVSGAIMEEEHCQDIRWWGDYTKAVSGIGTDANMGALVKNAGDWDGDGLGDILIGAPGMETKQPPIPGAVYLLFGYEDFFAHPIRIEDLRDVGLKFVTTKKGWHLGEIVSSGLDMNGDGLSDLLLAESSLFPDQAEGGASAYLIFGRSRYAFVRGDANDDGRIDLGDAIFILNYMFAAGAKPWCVDAADTNDDGNLDIGDAIYLLNYLFGGGGEPKMPFPRGGLDPTVDGLGCWGI